MNPACRNLSNKEMNKSCGFHNDLQEMRIL